MQLKEIRNLFHTKLQSLYDKMEIQSLFYLCLEKIEGKRRYDLMLNPDSTTVHIQKWETIIKELESEKPIQYVFKETEFYGLSFRVTEDVLIPRQETEELVEWIIDSVPTNQKKTRILDIGTGSGCIAISLAAHIEQAEVYAIDISEKALVVAKENAQKNKVDIRFMQTDILDTLDTFKSDIKFDVIVSNPPYVRELEKVEIRNNVLLYEPHLALFVSDANPLIFYEHISLLAKQLLDKEGQLYFEINQYLGKETMRLLEKQGFQNVELRKDLMQNDRMIRGVKGA